MAGEVDVQGIVIMGYDPTTHKYIPIQTSPPITDINNELYAGLGITLTTLIAGEDIPNNRQMISSETAQSNTLVLNNVSVLVGSAGTLTNAIYSTSINCANYRSYALAAWGAAGLVQALLQVTYDGGTTWQWHPNGFTSSAQFVLQNGANALIAPLCREIGRAS